MKRMLTLRRRPKHRYLFHSLPDIREDSGAEETGRGAGLGGGASGSSSLLGVNQQRQHLQTIAVVSPKVY